MSAWRSGSWRDGPGVLHVGVAASGVAATDDATGVRVPLEVAASYRARTRGLLGRDGIEGALLLTPASGVHTFRMRFTIDVAYLNRDLTVLAVRTMRPHARCVLEAEAGAMGSWGLRPGVRVRMRTAPEPWEQP